MADTSQYGTPQRIALFFAIVGMVVVVLLHNPLDGSTTHTLVTNSAFVPKDCPEEKRKEYERIRWTLRDLSTEEGRARELRNGELFNECFREESSLSVQDLPFSDWASKQPVVSWLGSVVHTLAGLGGMALVCAVLFVLFPGVSKRVDVSDHRAGKGE
jgi:hypothetical protein